MDKIFITMCFIAFTGLSLPCVYLYIMFKKYGKKLPSFWLGLPLFAVYFVMFFWLVPKLIPDSWRPIPYQVEECKTVTKYKERN